MAEQLDIFGDGPAIKVAPAYYNTTRLQGPALSEARIAAKLQEGAVLAIYRGARKPLSPSAVWRKGKDVLGDDWLLTSVRRAITNLTANGKLQKLEEYVDGPYGRPEHVWRLTP